MDKLQIGEVIQTLRRRKKVTQEYLANYIGVSTAAVSKWENQSSYPDIVILPKLARFFNVTIDELMDYKMNITSDDIANILLACEGLIASGNVEDAIRLADENIEKYPTSYLLKHKLMSVYDMYIMLCSDKNNALNTNLRSIEMLKDIISNSDDIDLRESSLFYLSSKYISLNELENAKECLLKIHVPEVDPNTILPGLYFEQGRINDGRRLLQNNVLKSFIQMYSSCSMLAATYCDYRKESDEKNLDIEKAKKYIDLAIKVKSVLYSGDKNFIPMDSNYLMLAKIYMNEEEIEKAIECLDKILHDAKQFNNECLFNRNQIWCFDYLPNEDQICSGDILNKTYENLAQMIESELNGLKNNERYINILQEIKELSRG